MYDSLRMTDYAIARISIHAFTSVEGSYENNVKLQNKRAESIVEALQTFQSEKIESHINATENWVEFLNDIQSTGYTSWMTLTKEEIKARLNSKETLARIEPVLQTHRKAIIEIKMEKRLSYKESDPKELKKYFEQVIADRNIEEALYLQQVIFHKIERQEMPEEFINELGIPEATEYGGLLINEAAFLYDRSYSDVFEAIKTFEDLDRLIPENPKIKYNLCALRIKAWVKTAKLVDPLPLKKSIEDLRKYKINDILIRRLLINYHIILSEVHMLNRDYKSKDKALEFIYKSYLPLKMNDDDLVNLSKYFSHYSRFDWARSVLAPRIKSIDASEDLIFYYLGLTIYDPRYTAGPQYRTTMLNAVNMNNLRFCDLFLPTSQGGISFQLLSDSFLKKILLRKLQCCE